MTLFNKLAVFLLASVVAAAPSPIPNFGNLVQHEARTAVPEGFVRHGSAPPDHTLRLCVGLVQSDIAGLEKVLYAVSTPGSPEYGKFKSKEEVEAFVKPAAESTKVVDAWLAASGIKHTTNSPAGDVKCFDISIRAAELLLGAKFYTFTHPATGQQLIRTLSYSVPQQLQGHLDFVHPTTTFDLPQTGTAIRPIPLANSKRAVPASCNNQVTPACLQELYGIPTKKATHPRNTITVPGFLNEWANKADLSLFLKNFRPDLKPAPTFTEHFIDGGRNDQNVPGIEANLDIQYTVGIASGVPTTFLSVGRNDTTAFMDATNYLLRQPTVPAVFPVSYGFNENAISPSVARSICNGYMQLGTRGTSVLFASGDGGVAGSRPDNKCNKFVPTFPASCPYVTAVGATTGIHETAAGLSAGGFSDIFARPSYQTDAVHGYLNKLGNQYDGRFNRNGRGFPDVSAQGQSIVIAYKGQGRWSMALLRPAIYSEA